MKYLYSLLIVASLSFSCQSEEQEDSSGFKVIRQDAPSPDATVELDEFVNIREIIRLETTDSSLVDNFHKVVFDGDLIFVKASRSVFKFGRDGAFLGKLSKNGKGPDEYMNLTDLVILPEERKVWVFDSKRLALLQYTYDFEFEKAIDVNHLVMGLEKLGEGLVGSPGYQSQFEDFHSLVFFEGVETAKNGYTSGALPFHPEKAKYLHIHRHDYFSKAPEGFNFVNSFNDTIYRVEENHVYPEYVVDFGSDKITEDELVGRDYKTIVDVFQHIHSGEKSFNIGNVVQFDKQLFYRFFHSGSPYLSVFDKTSGTLTSGSGLVYRYGDEAIRLDLEEMPFGALGDSKGYFVLFPEALSSREQKELFKLEDGDNPLLVVFEGR